RADEHGPGLYPQPRENRGIGIERMAGQKEADRVELAPQPFIERPWLGFWQRNSVDAFAAKQHALAGELLCLTAVRRGEDGFCGGMDARAIGFEVVESAGGGETFERSLIDLARIEFCRKMTEIAKGRCGGLAYGRYFRTAIDRRERIADRRFALAFGRLEIGARRLHRRRQDLDIEAPRLVAEFRELV